MFKNAWQDPIQVPPTISSMEHDCRLRHRVLQIKYSDQFGRPRVPHQPMQVSHPNALLSERSSRVLSEKDLCERETKTLPRDKKKVTTANDLKHPRLQKSLAVEDTICTSLSTNVQARRHRATSHDDISLESKIPACRTKTQVKLRPSLGPIAIHRRNNMIAAARFNHSPKQWVCGLKSMMIKSPCEDRMRHAQLYRDNLMILLSQEDLKEEELIILILELRDAIGLLESSVDTSQLLSISPHLIELAPKPPRLVVDSGLTNCWPHILSFDDTCFKYPPNETLKKVLQQRYLRTLSCIPKPERLVRKRVCGRTRSQRAGEELLGDIFRRMGDFLVRLFPQFRPGGAQKRMIQKMDGATTDKSLYQT